MRLEAPQGFSLDAYQALVRDAAGQAVCLALCDGDGVLFPRREALPAPVGAALEAWLRGARGSAVGPVVQQPLDLPGAGAVRLVAVPAAPAGCDAGAFARGVAEPLSRVAQCIRHVWGLCSELDEMTEELTARYEELNLIYQLDRIGGGDETDNARTLQALLEDTASHLAASLLAVSVPDETLEMVATPGGDGAIADAAQLRTAWERLRALARGNGGPIVLNREADLLRAKVPPALAGKAIVAPLGGGAGTGVVVAMRAADAEEFRNSDRKLVCAVADQVSALLRGSRDDLTGLLNRRGLERRLAAQLQGHAGRGGMLLHLDLHNFRVLNETCGRLAGDELLRQVAAVLGECTRDTDVIARIGGDEFAVLVDHCHPVAMAQVARDLMERVCGHGFLWAGRVQEVAASIGVVPLVGVEGDAQRLLSLAESACELAKESGANHCHLYCEDDEKLFEKRGQVQWVPRIRDALRNDRFELHAQVIVPVDPGSGRTLHQELLLRLRGEDGALVPPARFIPAAERFHLMPEIDRWVVSRALATLSDERWSGLARGAVWSMNLSGQSLSDERFHAFLLGAIEGSGVPCANLCFEVTETAAVANHRLASDLIVRLKALGVSFALDDFGAGLSSFAYLKSLPVDLLKIDGNFVKHLGSDAFSRATVDAVNRVAKVIGLATVAEYVEDDAILAVLRDLGVDYGQGYGLGRPRPLEQALTAMAADAAHGPPARVVPLLRPGAAGA